MKNTDPLAEARAASYTVINPFSIKVGGKKRVFALGQPVTGAELGAFLPDVLESLQRVTPPPAPAPVPAPEPTNP